LVFCLFVCFFTQQLGLFSQQESLLASSHLDEIRRDRSASVVSAVSVASLASATHAAADRLLRSPWQSMDEGPVHAQQQQQQQQMASPVQQQQQRGGATYASSGGFNADMGSGASRFGTHTAASPVTHTLNARLLETQDTDDDDVHTPIMSTATGVPPKF
jgi:hypothetical protein